MTAHSVRMMKDFRILAWPWMAVTGAAALAQILQASQVKYGPFDAEGMTAVGYFIGIPLLAGLVIGAEFQYRTLGLTLAQPISRAEIWRSKMIATFAAVLPATLLFAFSGNRIFHEFFQRSIWLTMSYLAVAAAAAFPMTLIARSTIGGMALQLVGTCPFLWTVMAITIRRGSHPIPSSWIAGLTVAQLLYAAGMVWLGRRMFLRYQAAEGMQSMESVVPGAALMPAFIADWFRCRPTGLVLNLVRREFRLLRAIWPMTFLALAMWTCLVMFHLLPVVDGTQSQGRFIVVVLTVMISVLIAVLAGALSLGEEKNWGTHEWQLTLPVSPSLQWFVKLSVAMFLSVFCGAILPISVLGAAGWYQGNPTLLFPIGLIEIWPVEMAIFTFAAFWCACLLKGTTRAVLFTFPTFMIIATAVPLGQWLPTLISAPTQRFFRSLISAWGPVESGRLVQRIAAALSFWDEKIFVIPVCFVFAIALIQSHRLFREPASDSKLRVVRYLSPMFAAVLICSLTVAFFMDFMKEAFPAQQKMSREIDSAIEKVIVSRPENKRPLHLNAEELAKSSSLGPESRRWLADSTIVIVPNPTFVMARAPWEFNFGFMNFSKSGEPSQPYSAVIRFDRSSCSISHRKLSPQAAMFAAVCN